MPICNLGLRSVGSTRHIWTNHLEDDANSSSSSSSSSSLGYSSSSSSSWSSSSSSSSRSSMGLSSSSSSSSPGILPDQFLMENGGWFELENGSLMVLE